MGKLTTSRLAICSLAGLAALSGNAFGAEDERWFRVELIAFANLWSEPPVGAALAEQWDATPELAYPAEFRFLVDLAQVEKNAGEFEGESLVDEYGRQIITLRGDPPDAPADGAGQVPGLQAEASETGPAAAADPQAPQPLTPVYAEPVPEEQPLALPTPFVLLPGAHQEFRAKVARMQRSGRYSILFHETWVQPVGSEETSLPIVLDRSGDKQQWPGLQGSIKIFLDRFLQVETELWLNTMGEYLPAGTWQMPAPPFGPPSLVIEEVEPVDLALAVDQLPTGSGQQATDQPATTEPEVAEAATGNDSELLTPAEQDPLAGMTPEQIELMAMWQLMDEEELEQLLEPEDPVYPFRHAVALQQKRRMRSGEVHYIDHPLLGLIIKFTPVRAQELAAIAESQEKPIQE